ncbi:MAG: HAD family hydrolase [Casimicrobiaceae bacterium]
MSAPGERWQPLKEVTVFFDRDGTLNPDPGYISRPEDFELHPGAGTALSRLNRAGARVIVLTNQSGIGRGKFTLADLRTIHDKLQDLLALHGARLDAIYHCPHRPDEGCSCRKPATGMAERAIAEHALNRSRMYLVGDQSGDIEMAKRLEARSVLVTTGHGSRETLAELSARGLPPDCVADCLRGAVDWIFQDANLAR